jgi:hypothetical protein
VVLLHDYFFELDLGLGCIVERTKVEFEFGLEQVPVAEARRLRLNFAENGGLAIPECCTSKVWDCVLDFGRTSLEGGRAVSEIKHTLQEESSQLSLIRAIVSVRLFDFGSGFGLARFGEVCKNLSHQRVVREVGIIIWVVLGRFVVARIARWVGVAFWIASRGTFIKYFSKEGPTFALTSPSDRIRVRAQVVNIFRRFGKTTEVRYVLEGCNTLRASSHGHNGSARIECEFWNTVKDYINSLGARLGEVRRVRKSTEVRVERGLASAYRLRPPLRATLRFRGKDKRRDISQEIRIT